VDVSGLVYNEPHG